MDHKKVISFITDWLKKYSDDSGTNGFVIGISGGIDSAVTSTLCALTGKKLIVLNLPIRQKEIEFDRSTEHIAWLKKHFKNVSSHTVDLTGPFENLEKTSRNTSTTIDSVDDSPRRFSRPSATRSRMPGNTGHD